MAAAVAPADAAATVAAHDLTHTIAKHLDKHLVLPLLEFLQTQGCYEQKSVLRAKLALLEKTNMIDFAIDIYKVSPTCASPRSAQCGAARRRRRRRALADPRADGRCACVRAHVGGWMGVDCPSPTPPICAFQPPLAPKRGRENTRAVAASKGLSDRRSARMACVRSRRRSLCRSSRARRSHRRR